MDRQRASKLKTHQGQHADEPRASTEAVFLGVNWFVF
jgi:hypothetical protein